MHEPPALMRESGTKRKTLVPRLLKAGVLQDAIYKSTNFSSIATDAEGVIQIFNVGAERMLGYDANEVVNKITPASISDPEELAARSKALSEEFGTAILPGFETLIYKAGRGIEDIYEQTFIRKDGSRFPVLVSVTALYGEEGGVIGYLMIGTDNTERKRVEAIQAQLDQRLRDQQFYTRSLIESNIDALIATDPQGIISDVNEQMVTLTGCTRDALIGTPFKNYFTDPARAQLAIERALTDGTVTNFELTALAKDGRKTIVSYNASTFYDRDRTLQGVFAAARDVTERIQFEVALQDTNGALENARAIAEKANLAKSEFLSRMSHELRTPLNAVLGFAQVLATDIPPPTLPQKQAIEQILNGGWYLLRLINEILDLSAIESGKLSMSIESMSLAEVLQDCEAMMEAQAMERGVRMHFPIVDGDCLIMGDRTRVKQVMINLLSNAIKYNRKRGAITVQLSVANDKRIRVTVHDTGIGLSSEQIEQLFQPFNRLGQEAGSEEGTGIGLVVTRQLVEQMGGAIGVESQVGEGSSFWVEFLPSAVLPLPSVVVSSLTGNASDALAADASGACRTLIYFEDNPANLALVERLLTRRSDVRLLAAIDGHAGLQLVESNPPAVILMDINLPGLNGYEVLRRLRANPATAHIPVIALSANAMPRDIEKGIEAGFLRYLTKPIQVVAFMDAIDEALYRTQPEERRHAI